MSASQTKHILKEKVKKEKLSGDRRKMAGKFSQESVIVGHPCCCQASHWRAECVKNVAQGGEP